MPATALQADGQQGEGEGGMQEGDAVPSCESACQPIATVVILVVVVALAGNFVFAKWIKRNF